MNLELNPDEAELISGILDYLGNLRMEISDTDS